jgi:uncharacterized protein (DUF2141 family)
MPVFQKREFDSMEYISPEQMRPVGPGVYELTGVPAGRYEVRMQGADAGEAGAFSELDLTRDGQDLSATEGEALGKLTVTVKMPGNEPLPSQYGVGLRDARQRAVAFRQGDANGQASFEALKPGKYTMAIGAMGKWYSVVRTISGAAETAGNEVNVTAGASMEVTAELTGGEVRIEGVVEKDGKLVSGVMVVLVPKDPETHVDLFRRDQSDFDGTFLLRGVIPGMYTVVAVEDAWGFDWFKAGVLARDAQKGQNVIVAKMRGWARD